MNFLSDPVAYAIPLFVIFMIAERYVAYREHLDWYNDPKDSFASIAMGIGSVIINLGVKALALAGYFAIYQLRLFDLGWDWWVWILIVFADDFTFYWHHRLSHEIRILWAAHVNHHSSQKYNLTTALRQSWGEELYKYIWWIWLPLVGFHPLMIMIMQSFSLIYQFLLHTQAVKKLGFLELFLNTPSHHRVHHGSNATYLDRNHGAIFIIWDKMFGTFEAENSQVAVKYGIVSNIHTYNPFNIATHELIALWHDMKNAPTWKDSLLYALMPPGWQPNGKGKTSKELRAEWKQQQQHNQ